MVLSAVIRSKHTQRSQDVYVLGSLMSKKDVCDLLQEVGHIEGIAPYRGLFHDGR